MSWPSGWERPPEVLPTEVFLRSRITEAQQASPGSDSVTDRNSYGGSTLPPDRMWPGQRVDVMIVVASSQVYRRSILLTTNPSLEHISSGTLT
jgi:hypothetical protein